MPTVLTHRSADTRDTSTDFPLRAFFGHHKCATGWTDEILREICYHMGISFDIVTRAGDFAEYESLGAYVAEHSVDFLAYINANAQHVADLPLHRGFHVVRDPRDVLVSGYFSHKHSHPTEDWPELVPHRATLQALPKSEGLHREMEFSRPFFEDMYSWDYDRDDILELRMENVTRRPHAAFIRIARFLGILDDGEAPALKRLLRSVRYRYNRLTHKGERFTSTKRRPLPLPLLRHRSIPTGLIHQIVKQHRFERLAGRRRGEENVQSHYRKGVPGDWKNHFDPEHVRAFKDRYNDLLLTLGYEDDPDWGLE